jgi:polysaccharide biosynthesis protein PelF
VADIVLLTEGTYPYHYGGVGVWCDQLVHEMREHTFRVVALVGAGTEPVVWPLPANVVSIEPVPMWGRPPAGLKPGRGARARFQPVLAELIDVLLRPARSDSGRFGEILRTLAEYSQRESLTGCFTSEQAVRLLIDAWHDRGHRSGPDEATEEGLLPAPTLHDALSALELLEHALRPLRYPTPRGDILHASTNGLGVLPGLTAKWRYGTPMVISEHGVYLREQYLHARTGPYRWPVKALYLNFVRHLGALAYEEATSITSCNIYNRRWQERLGAPSSVIRTVYNGIDPANFPEIDDEPDVPTIVWVGRVDPIKDVETLLRSFALVRKELPEARLRMYGAPPSGLEGYLERCRRLAVELGVADAATFEGRTEDLCQAYTSGHVVVLCSVSEGLPFTVIEAMTLARPCVATDVGGVGEAIGDTGVTVPPRQPEALAQACLTLLRDTPLRRRLGAAARVRALSMFTVDHVVSAFTEIYNLVGTEGDEEGAADEQDKENEEVAA